MPRLEVHSVQILEKAEILEKVEILVVLESNYNAINMSYLMFNIFNVQNVINCL